MADSHTEISQPNQEKNDNNNFAIQANGIVLCEICNSDESKYKCPKCLCRTCSLPCVKQHRVSGNCNGVRCKTAFVAIKDFNENHMLSDYRMLEEISRACDNSERSRMAQEPERKMMKSMKIQKNKARRMEVNLKFLPVSFTRRKINSTFYKFSSQCFLWHVEWVFQELDICIHNKRVPDTTKLADALKNCLSDEMSIHPKVKDYLKDASAQIYIKALDAPSNNDKYHKLDPELTLKDNLIGKTILEYPQFVVVRQKNALQ